jgi:CDP-glucose 4,6-dehydratase
MAATPALTGTYRGKRVLVTGHTGFKGSWLTLWLHALGASVTGYSLAADECSLFRQADVASRCEHIEADVRDVSKLIDVVERTVPDFVFHLAAQSLVRRSYREPLATFETNVQGTANVLGAVHRLATPCAVVIVTSDKCYENDGRRLPYSEDDRLGGRDPYSASKGAAEIVTASYRASFFPDDHHIAVATARSGNVIGGGDWSEDRLVPDAIRALENDESILVRNRHSVRPWQHVLDPLSGYLLLGAKLANGEHVREAWNFGPDATNTRSVSEVVEEILRNWGSGTWTDASDSNAPHEAAHLSLSIEKARTRLDWIPRWAFDEAIRRTVGWYRCATAGASSSELAELCHRQIVEHSS